MAEYSEHIIGLKDTVRKNTRRSGDALMQAIDELLKEAESLGDDGLFGFVYYYLADRYYFMIPDREKYDHYLNLAVRHLLRSDERELLGLTYTQVAVDAHNVGSFTIAYQYYLAALTIADGLRGSSLRASVCANIGRLLTELGYHELAETYLAEALKRLERHKGNGLYYRNVITVSYLCGINAMNLHKREAAREYLDRIGERVSKSEDGIFMLIMLFLQARIFLEEGDDVALDNMMPSLIARLRQANPVYDFMEDIRNLCLPLIAHGKREYVRSVLDEVGASILECGNVHTERVYYELRLGALEEDADYKAREADLMELHKRLTLEYEEQNRRSIETIALSSMMAEVRLSWQDVLAENEILHRQADTDALTGLPNRYALNEALEAAFDRARESGTSLCVGILDVDYFKEYNDNYGHQAGDVTLNAVAQAIGRISRQEKVFCARYGGDEFLVLIENADRDRIERMAQELREDISSFRIRHEYSRISDYVTLSQGYCYGVPAGRDKSWDFLSEADRVLYAVKKARKNSVATPTYSIMEYDP